MFTLMNLHFQTYFTHDLFIFEVTSFFSNKKKWFVIILYFFHIRTFFFSFTKIAKRTIPKKKEGNTTQLSGLFTWAKTVNGNYLGTVWFTVNNQNGKRFRV